MKNKYFLHDYNVIDKIKADNQNNQSSANLFNHIVKLFTIMISFSLNRFVCEFLLSF